MKNDLKSLLSELNLKMNFPYFNIGFHLFRNKHLEFIENYIIYTRRFI